MPFQPKQHNIDFDALQSHFHLPMAQVAKKFDVCLTFFKKICRQHGIKRWPYRKLKSLEKRITTTIAPEPEPDAEPTASAEPDNQFAHLQGLKSYGNYFAAEHRAGAQASEDEDFVHPRPAASQRASKRRRVATQHEEEGLEEEEEPKRPALQPGPPPSAFDPMAALAQLACASRLVEEETRTTFRKETEEEASREDYHSGCDSAETVPATFSGDEEVAAPEVEPEVATTETAECSTVVSSLQGRVLPMPSLAMRKGLPVPYTLDPALSLLSASHPHLASLTQLLPSSMPETVAGTPQLPSMMSIQALLQQNCRQTQ